MAAKRHERRTARRAALKVLYAGEINNYSSSYIIDNNLLMCDDEDKLNSYALVLIKGVEEHKEAIDKLLADTSDNWDINRMPIVDKCLLRIAVFEMLYIDAVPVSVCINEAVDLAKEFGGETESGKFVNGILGAIAKLHPEKED